MRITKIAGCPRAWVTCALRLLVAPIRVFLRFIVIAYEGVLSPVYVFQEFSKDELTKETRAATCYFRQIRNLPRSTDAEGGDRARLKFAVGLLLSPVVFLAFMACFVLVTVMGGALLSLFAIFAQRVFDVRSRLGEEVAKRFGNFLHHIGGWDPALEVGVAVGFLTLAAILKAALGAFLLMIVFALLRFGMRIPVPVVIVLIVAGIGFYVLRWLRPALARRLAAAVMDVCVAFLVMLAFAVTWIELAAGLLKPVFGALVIVLMGAVTGFYVWRRPLRAHLRRYPNDESVKKHVEDDQDPQEHGAP